MDFKKKKKREKLVKKRIEYRRNKLRRYVAERRAEDDKMAIMAKEAAKLSKLECVVDLSDIGNNLPANGIDNNISKQDEIIKSPSNAGFNKDAWNKK